MAIPCIIIRRHDISLYEWFLVYNNEKVDSEAIDSSIFECLASAAASLPEDVILAEVQYRGLHMGTFSKFDLIEFPEAVASRIVELYGALAQHLG